MKYFGTGLGNPKQHVNHAEAEFIRANLDAYNRACIDGKANIRRGQVVLNNKRYLSKVLCNRPYNNIFEAYSCAKM